MDSFLYVQSKAMGHESRQAEMEMRKTARRDKQSELGKRYALIKEPKVWCEVK